MNFVYIFFFLAIGRYRNRAIVDLLLDYGAQLNQPDLGGGRPLHHAAVANNSAACGALVRGSGGGSGWQWLRGSGGSRLLFK
jgi:ankyrin repeat protein